LRKGKKRATHLSPDVLETRRADNREANEENVGLGVTQRPQAIVVLLSGRVPQAEVDGLAVDHDVCRVVVEDGGDVLALFAVGKSMRGCENGEEGRVRRRTGKAFCGRRGE
jgi:hypothetical protein